jgi:hypothetical protein
MREAFNLDFRNIDRQVTLNYRLETEEYARARPLISQESEKQSAKSFMGNNRKLIPAPDMRSVGIQPSHG